MTLEFKTAESAALVLKYGDTDQAVVKGLNRLGLPSYERQDVTVDEFRQLMSRKFTTGLTLGDITFGGNMVVGDTKGQDQLKAYLKDNTKFTDARLYLDLEDFLAVDLANDEDTAWQVGGYTPGEADKNGIFSLSGRIVSNGRVAYFTKHLEGTSPATIAFVNGGASEDTITDSDSGFVDAGFVAGDTLIVEGSTSNDGQYLIKEVAAGTLTLTCIGTLTAESGLSGTALHGGGF